MGRKTYNFSQYQFSSIYKFRARRCDIGIDVVEVVDGEEELGDDIDFDIFDLFLLGFIRLRSATPRFLFVDCC